MKNYTRNPLIPVSKLNMDKFEIYMHIAHLTDKTKKI